MLKEIVIFLRAPWLLINFWRKLSHQRLCMMLIVLDVPKNLVWIQRSHQSLHLLKNWPLERLAKMACFVMYSGFFGSRHDLDHCQNVYYFACVFLSIPLKVYLKTGISSCQCAVFQLLNWLILFLNFTFFTCWSSSAYCPTSVSAFRRY